MTEPRDRIARRGRDHEIRQRADEVSPEADELHEHRLEIIQRECLLKLRDQDVVEHGH